MKLVTRTTAMPICPSCKKPMEYVGADFHGVVTCATETCGHFRTWYRAPHVELESATGLVEALLTVQGDRFVFITREMVEDGMCPYPVFKISLNLNESCPDLVVTEQARVKR